MISRQSGPADPERIAALLSTGRGRLAIGVPMAGGEGPHGGLVRSRKTGSVRTFELVPQPLKAAERWMIEQRALWEPRLNQLENYLNELEERDQ